MGNDVYVYALERTLYVNLTNRCPNACAFCLRQNGDTVAGNYMILKNKPSFKALEGQYNALLANGEYNSEIVFCGYGEPTEELELLKTFAAYLKKCGKKVRLNTNGLGSLINGRDITVELKGLVDTVSVSLNHHNSQGYYEITKSRYGLNAFPALTEFCKNCKNVGIETILTVVDTISSEDINKCKQLADSIGATLRIRSYISDNYN